MVCGGDGARRNCQLGGGAANVVLTGPGNEPIYPTSSQTGQLWASNYMWVGGGLKSDI